MAKQPTAKPAAAPADNETLNGSNTLPALVEVSANKSVQLGDIVAAAHQQSGLSVEAWNALAEDERDNLLNKVVADLKAQAAVAALPAELVGDLSIAAEAAAQGTADALQERDAEANAVFEQVLVISAPGGPRRRAGFGFGPVPVDLMFDQLGDTQEKQEATLMALRADPMLKIDGRMREIPAE